MPTDPAAVVARARELADETLFPIAQVSTAASECRRATSKPSLPPRCTAWPARRSTAAST